MCYQPEALMNPRGSINRNHSPLSPPIHMNSGNPLAPGPKTQRPPAPYIHYNGHSIHSDIPALLQKIDTLHSLNKTQESKIQQLTTALARVQSEKAALLKWKSMAQIFHQKLTVLEKSTDILHPHLVTSKTLHTQQTLQHSHICLQNSSIADFPNNSFSTLFYKDSINSEFPKEARMHRYLKQTGQPSIIRPNNHHKKEESLRSISESLQYLITKLQSLPLEKRELKNHGRAISLEQIQKRGRGDLTHLKNH